MTTKEKMMACYRNESADIQVAGIYNRFLLRGSMEREVRNMGLGLIDQVMITSMYTPPWHLYEDMFSEVKNTSISVEYYWENGVMKHRRKYVTPVGELYAGISKSKGAGSEAISHFYIQDIEDYDVMKYLVENTVLHSNSEMFAARQEEIGEDGVVLARLDRAPYQKLLVEIAGAENYFVDLITDPEPVESLMEAMNKKLDEAVQLALDSPAEILWMCENLSCDMTPPSRFEEYNLKCYQKYSKWAHEAGKLLFMHVDGKAKPLVNLLNETGMDGFESVSDPIMAGDMTYEEFLNAFPDKGILPNLPANLADDTEGKLEEFIEKTKAISKKYNRALMIQVSEDLRPDLYATALPRLLKAIND